MLVCLATFRYEMTPRSAASSRPGPAAPHPGQRVIKGDKIGETFELIRSMPFREPPPLRVDLEALQCAVALGQQYAWQPPAPPA
jgi:hypothetical protein